jgi:hypothetical protein
MIFIDIRLNLDHVIFSLLDPSRRIVIGMLVVRERFLALQARSNWATIRADGDTEFCARLQGSFGLTLVRCVQEREKEAGTRV